MLNLNVQEFGLNKTIYWRICQFTSKRYSASVVALSSVAVDLGPLYGKILKRTVSLSPNSCIFQFSTLKYTNSIPAFFGIETICWSIGPSTVKILYIVQTLKHPAHHETPKSSALVLKNMVSMTHTSLKWPFLADFKKYTHDPPPPPPGTKFWLIGLTVQKPRKRAKSHHVAINQVSLRDTYVSWGPGNQANMERFLSLVPTECSLGVVCGYIWKALEKGYLEPLGWVCMWY